MCVCVCVCVFYLFTFLYFEPDEPKLHSPILFQHTFNIILPFTPGSSKYFLSFRLPHQNLHSFPSTHALCTGNFIFLIQSVVLCEVYKCEVYKCEVYKCEVYKCEVYKCEVCKCEMCKCEVCKCEVCKCEVCKCEV